MLLEESDNCLVKFDNKSIAYCIFFTSWTFICVKMLKAVSKSFFELPNNSFSEEDRLSLLQKRKNKKKKDNNI